MKKIDTVYKFGNLYDVNTRKRLVISDGATVSLTIDPEDVLKEDPNLKPKRILKKEEKEDQIKKTIGNYKYWNLFQAGKLLYFKISAGVKRKDGTEEIVIIFELRLLEDLYIYNKRKEPKYARFFDCHCLVERCFGNLDFFEPMYATSLNDALTKTYELYFAMFGKSTANAFDRVCESKTNMKKPIREITEAIQK